MMKSQILKYVNITKAQKYRHLENKILFLFKIKKFINYKSKATLWQKAVFLAEVSFNDS